MENMQAVYDPDKKTVTFSTAHFGQYFVAENKVSFSDLAGFESYRKYIESMAVKNVINGVGAGMYAPAKTLTRAEFATLLAKALKLDQTLDISNAQKFNDVKDSDWFAKYVKAASTAGLIKGVGAGNFAPGATITEQDMAVIVSRTAETYKQYTAQADESVITFTDASKVSGYARMHVAGLMKAKVMELDGNGLFNPTRYVNRAEAAKIMYMFFNMK